MTTDSRQSTAQVERAKGLMARVLSGLALTLLLLIVFLIINVVHFHYFRVRVVAYDALFDVGVAILVTALVYIIFLRKHMGAGGLESGLFLVIGALCAMLYAIMVPTVIDRSLSIYILEKLNQRGGAIRESAFEGILVHEFFPEHQLVAIRLTEQQNSGTITIQDGCVRLTPRGQEIARWTRLFRSTMLPRRREIMGRFSDDLTDPFRHSPEAPAYGCD